MASIARRYRVSTAQVAQWNDVAEAARFKRGQTVVVYLPAKRVRVAAGDSRNDAAQAKPSTQAKSKPVRVAAKSTNKPAKKVANSGQREAAAGVRVAESGSRDKSSVR